jgi:glyoxylase-like metal-dependent hydrolase (beta-lactamase superfamily II)
VIWERAVAENAWQLDDGLYRILLPLPFAVSFVNVYVLASRGEYVLVDAGIDWLPSLRALGAALKVIGVPPRGLTALLLTHLHPDHGGGAASVQSRWGGRVLLHPAERGQFGGGPTNDGQAWLAENGVDEAVVRQAATTRERPAPQPREIEDLADDQPFRVGDLSFDVILVPGHSPGQVMLREPERGWLLSADHVIPVHAVNVWSFPGAKGDPFGEYLASLERTIDLPASLVLPSHGLPWRGNARPATQAMIDYHLVFLDRVRRLVSEKPMTAWEIARALRPEIPSDPAGIRFSLAEVLAALTHLERRGDALRTADGRWEQVTVRR